MAYNNNNNDKFAKKKSKIVRPEPNPIALPEDFGKSDFSKESIEVLEYFGLEAPTLLNDFAIALEDALIEVVKKYTALKKEHQELQDKQK